MNEKKFCFPFGQELKKVEQVDKSPKKVFVLGVYASAVHARWIGVDGKQLVRALAVASEPEIFWRGDRADEIISKIKVPKGAGRLEPASKHLNGPSGIALDELFLKPLGYSREDAWLCDLLPESRVNPGQQNAIEDKYLPLVESLGLSMPTIPQFNKKELNNPERALKIVDELEQSQADNLILLGDEPVKWFLMLFDKRFKKLSDFGKTPESYGSPQKINIQGKSYNVIALCHPRQAARLGNSSEAWGILHDGWVKKK